jgi:hypothetical protein
MWPESAVEISCTVDGPSRFYQISTGFLSRINITLFHSIHEQSMQLSQPPPLADYAAENLASILLLRTVRI